MTLSWVSPFEYAKAAYGFFISFLVNNEFERLNYVNVALKEMLIRWLPSGPPCATQIDNCFSLLSFFLIQSNNFGYKTVALWGVVEE